MNNLESYKDRGASDSAFFLLLISVLLAATATAAETTGRDTNVEYLQSATYLQRQADETAEKMTEIDDVLARLESAKNRAIDELTTRGDTRLNDVQSLSKSVSDSLQEMAADAYWSGSRTEFENKIQQAAADLRSRAANLQDAVYRLNPLYVVRAFREGARDADIQFEEAMRNIRDQSFRDFEAFFDRKQFNDLKLLNYPGILGERTDLPAENSVAQLKSIYQERIRELAVSMNSMAEEFSAESKADLSGKIKTAVDSAFAAETKLLTDRREVHKARLYEISKILDERSKKGGASLTSTNYMMLLLAFSFGVTVLLRAYRADLPIITDRTLVEYGGMSFLILAVIILASADRISSETVGPLLGTIAGYIFGRSVQAGPEKPRKTEENNTVPQGGG